MWQLLNRISFAFILFAMLVTPVLAEGTVARAQFSTDVIDREPIDNLGPVVKVVYDEIQKVYFFTDLRDMEGQTVIHQWKLNGEDYVDVSFDIGGDRWRVWSSKRLLPGFDGRWRVDIVLDGVVIESHSFDYVYEY